MMIGALKYSRFAGQLNIIMLLLADTRLRVVFQYRIRPSGNHDK